MQLTDLGWNEHFSTCFDALAVPDASPARVACDYGASYTVVDARGERPAEVSRGSGLIRGLARPSVGDWVAVCEAPYGPARIAAVLERQGAFVRRAVGKATAPQVVAANVDTAFLVCGLDGDFNPRRIERYLTLTWESGARPVVLLNKADVCPDSSACIHEAEAVALGVSVHAISLLSGDGVDAIRTYLEPGRTIALLGSSGTGKSTLVNALLGESRQATSAVRDDDSRGRHTTTRRELVALSGGAVLIDTPGMRELQLWASEGSLEETFDDVRVLAEGCRFSDCSHEHEPGCAVQAALADGTLPSGRIASYRKLKRELRYLERREDVGAARAEKARWKQIHMSIRRQEKQKGQ